MTLNEIKKELIKKNPVAKLEFIANGALHYSTILGTETIGFKISFEETSGGFFYSTMPAKILLRWIDIEVQQKIELGE